LRFVPSGTYEGRPRYAAVSLTTAAGHVYALARDNQGQLLEVRDPEGRSLRVSYRELALPAIRTWSWSI